MRKTMSFLLCGLLLLGLCACEKNNGTKGKTSSGVKYSTASIPEYTGTEGDTIKVELSGNDKGNHVAVKKVLPSGATVISITKKSKNSSGTGQSGAKDPTQDLPEEVTCFDFVLNFDTSDITVLQLTDFRVIDSAQQRSKGKLNDQFTTLYQKSNMKSLLFDSIDAAVNKVKPDLIIITGNLVHGQFDDLGTSFTEVVKHMESLNTFWAPVFGDLDGISAQGAAWQCKQLTNAAHCLFKNTDGITGNSNYSIGIGVNGNIVRSIYLMDSNSCPNTSDLSVSSTLGMDETQINWLKDSVLSANKAIGKTIPSLVAFNLPSADITDALVSAGYEGAGNDTTTYEIGKEVTSKNGDFGIKGAKLVCGHSFGKLGDTLKSLGVDGVFMGANASSNISVLYNGIRWTIGSKTGKYDTSYTINGGTKIKISNGGKMISVSEVAVE